MEIVFITEELQRLIDSYNSNILEFLHGESDESLYRYPEAQLLYALNRYMGRRIFTSDYMESNMVYRMKFYSNEDIFIDYRTRKEELENTNPQDSKSIYMSKSHIALHGVDTIIVTVNHKILNAIGRSSDSIGELREELLLFVSNNGLLELNYGNCPWAILKNIIKKV